jgi:site-specific recombinase XerD
MAAARKSPCTPAAQLDDGAPIVHAENRRHRRRSRVRARGSHAFAPHQLRHAHAIELAGEGVPINIIQRQLGHSDLGVTSIYLQGIDVAEIIDTVHRRQPPMMPASVGVRLVQ